MEINPNAQPKADKMTKILRPARSTKAIVSTLANNWAEATMIDDVFADKVEPASSKIWVV